MIEQIYGMYYPVCDGCGAALEPQESDEDAQAAMKLAKWKKRIARGSSTRIDYLDYCTNCDPEANTVPHDKVVDIGSDEEDDDDDWR